MKSIVHRSGSELIHGISSRDDGRRSDYIEHATELAEFADELWNDRNLNKATGKLSREEGKVNAVDYKKVETRTCHHCKKRGHIEKNCISKKKTYKDKTEEKKNDKFAFSVVCNSEDRDDEVYQKAEELQSNSSVCSKNLTGNRD